MSLRFQTQRLLIAEATEEDVDGLLVVALSNSDFTAEHEGSAGEPGHFDRDMLERDLAVAWMDPARHPLVVRDKRDPDRVIGWAEVLEEHPRDAVPWIGLLEVHRDEQRRGYGRETVAALLEWARDVGATAVRCGVDEGSASGRAFCERLGFRVVDERERIGPAGRVRITVREFRLRSEHPGAGESGSAALPGADPPDHAS